MSRERYSKQLAWYQHLGETERSLLDYICSEILNRAGQALMALNGETLLRKALTTGEDSTKFYQEEQKNALNLALARPLHNQVELSDLLKSILYEIRTGEISAADLYHLNSDGPEFSGSKADPWSFKWFEPAVEVASYLVYVAQIEHIVRSGILESNRRPENESVYSINEILQLLARQVIISVGGMDEILGQKQLEGSTKPPTKQFFTFDGKHTPEQRNKYRQWLISKEIIENISQDEFEYLFNVNKIYEGMPTIIFREVAAQARTLLTILIDGFESIPIREKRFVRANLCITLKSGKKISRNTKVAKEDIFKDMLK